MLNTLHSRVRLPAGRGRRWLVAIALPVAAALTVAPLAGQADPPADGGAEVDRRQLLRPEAVRAPAAENVPLTPRTDARSIPIRADSADGGTHPALLGLAGIGAAGIGILGGFVAGAAQSCRGETSRDAAGTCALAGGFWGAAVGTTVAVPLTVHLLNGRRGSWAWAQAASVGAFALGAAVAASADDISSPGTAVVLVSIPLGQAVASVAVEKGTAP